MSASAVISGSGWSRNVCASQRRAPSRCRRTPRSRHAADRAESSSQRGHEAPGVAQRHLDQDGGQPAGDRGEVVGGGHDGPGREVLDLEVLQDPRPVELVDQEVAEVGHRDAPAALAVAPDAQRDLLRHHPRGEVRRRGRPQHRGDLRLEARHGAALAVGVPLLDAEVAARGGELVEHLGRRLEGPPGHRPGAGPCRRPEPGGQVVGHGSGQAGPRTWMAMSPASSGPATSNAFATCGWLMWESMSACERHSSMVTKVPGTDVDG